MGLKKSNEKQNILTELMLAFIGVWAIVEVFISGFDINFLNNMYVFYCAGATAVFYLLFKYMSAKRFKALMAGVVVFFILVFVMGSSFLQYGMYGLINAMDIGVHIDGVIAYDFLLIYITAVVAMVFALSIVKERSMYATIGVMPGFVLCMVFGRMPSALAFVLVFIYAIGASIYKKGNAVYTIGVFITVVILYLAVLVLFPAKNHKNESWLYKLGQLIGGQKQEELVEAHGGIGAGKLGSVDKLEFNHEKVMTLQTGYSGNVYLKGFVASVYKDNSWQPLDSNKYNNVYGAAFDDKWYSINKYNQEAVLFSIIDKDYEVLEDIFGSDEAYYKSVLNRAYVVRYDKGASRGYWYMPYGNQYFVNNKSEPDGYPLDCEQGHIASEQYIYMSGEYDRIKEYLSDYSGNNSNLKNYIEWEKLYRRFVEYAYTGVSDNVSKSITNAKVEVPKAEELGNMKHRLEYAAALKKYFADNFSYTLEPGAVPEGKDFFDYFLTESNKGYCTYYATAATLILRNAGIPARYVEGYVVNTDSGEGSHKEVKRYVKDYITVDSYTERKVEVFDDCSHAWVEIYMNGYGWVPYEFTPGYTSTNQTSGDDVEVKENEEAEKETNGNKDLDNTEDEVESVPAFDEEKEYNNLSEYFNDNKILDLRLVLWFLWLDIVRFIKFLLKVLLVLFVLTVIVFIPSYVSSVKKKRLFRIDDDSNQEKTRKQVIDTYIYLHKLCCFLGIRRTDTMSGQTYINNMKASHEYFEEAKVECIINAMEKLSYGRGNIGREEMKRVVNAINIIHKRSYEELTFIKKLLYRFVWHLY